MKKVKSLSDQISRLNIESLQQQQTFERLETKMAEERAKARDLSPLHDKIERFKELTRLFRATLKLKQNNLTSRDHFK